MLSPEWLRALSTAIPVLLALMWVLKLQGHLWRRTVWQNAGNAVTAVHNVLGGTLRTRWLGYEVQTEAVRVRWSGGIYGERTVIRTSAGVQRMSGWVDADAVLAHMPSGQLDDGPA